MGRSRCRCARAAPAPSSLAASKRGRLRQHAVDLHRAAAAAEAATVPPDLAREVLVRPRGRGPWCAGCAPETTSGARTSSPLSRVDAGDATIADVDRAHRRAGADRRAARLGAPRERLADRADPALHVAPGARDAVQLAEVVVEQVVRGAGCPRSRPDAHHARRCDRALDGIGLEPVVEQVAHGHRHHPEQLVHVPLRQPCGAACLAQEPRAGHPGRFEPSAGGGRSSSGRRNSRGAGQHRPRTRGRRRRPSSSSGRARPACAPCRRRRRSACRRCRRWRARVERHGLVAEVVQPELRDDFGWSIETTRRRARRACPATAPRSRRRRRGRRAARARIRRRPARAR